MIEKHYSKYIRSDVDEQLARILGQSETLVKPLAKFRLREREKRENKGKKLVGPPGLEPGTNRL